MNYKLPDTITINTNPYQQPVWHLVGSNDPILKQVAPEFDFSNPPADPILIANKLIEHLHQYGGIGLSACQVNMNYRVFVIGIDENIVAFFNPKIIGVSKETEPMKEGCLSFPGMFIQINRPVWIDVTYQDFKGELREARFTGLTSKVFQHEEDHLNGILFTDRAGKFALQRAKQALEKQHKKYERSKK